LIKKCLLLGLKVPPSVLLNSIILPIIALHNHTVRYIWRYQVDHIAISHKSYRVHGLLLDY